MDTEILDGKGLSQKIKEEIAIEVTDWVAQGHRRPHLAAVLVGQDGASRTYVDHKVKSCAQVGFESTLIERAADVSQQELLEIVAKLNADPSIDGFIVQLPLPDHIDDQAVIEAVIAFERCGWVPSLQHGQPGLGIARVCASDTCGYHDFAGPVRH